TTGNGIAYRVSIIAGGRSAQVCASGDSEPWKPSNGRKQQSSQELPRRTAPDLCVPRLQNRWIRPAIQGTQAASHFLSKLNPLLGTTRDASVSRPTVLTLPRFAALDLPCQHIARFAVARVF